MEWNYATFKPKNRENKLYSEYFALYARGGAKH